LFHFDPKLSESSSILLNEHQQVREANLDGITLAQNGFA
jgi:hypothetical protein